MSLPRAQQRKILLNIAEVTGSNPIEALIFFSSFFFPIALIGKFTAMITLPLNTFLLINKFPFLSVLLDQWREWIWENSIS